VVNAFEAHCEECKIQRRAVISPESHSKSEVDVMK
jgi:hypothetical protein